jgi:hypothetical protein
MIGTGVDTRRLADAAASTTEARGRSDLCERWVTDSSAFSAPFSRSPILTVRAKSALSPFYDDHIGVYASARRRSWISRSGRGNLKLRTENRMPALSGMGVLSGCGGGGRAVEIDTRKTSVGRGVYGADGVESLVALSFTTTSPSSTSLKNGARAIPALAAKAASDAIDAVRCNAFQRVRMTSLFGLAEQVASALQCQHRSLFRALVVSSSSLDSSDNALRRLIQCSASALTSH